MAAAISCATQRRVKEHFLSYRDELAHRDRRGSSAVNGAEMPE